MKNPQSTNSPFIQVYQKEHEEKVIDMITHIQINEYNVAITKEDQPDLLNVKDYYQTGKGNFWVATIEDEVVGTISLLDIGNEQLALRKMFVKKEYRGSTYQIAKQLLQTAIKWAKEKRVKEIFLGTTPMFLAAHRFYEKNGFVSIPQEQLPKDFPVMKVDKKFYMYTIS